jgi:O-antigen/teichoic acid export membrane protein
MTTASKRNVVLGFVDQAVLSVGSLLYLVSAAQNLGPLPLGEFSISAASILLVLSVVRAVCGEALLVREGRQSDQNGGRAMLGVALVASLVASGIFAIIGLLWEQYALIYWGAAIATPAIILQDSIRYLWINGGKGVRLLAGDVLTVAGNVLAIFGIGLLFQSPSLMIVAWGCVCLLSSLIIMFSFRMWPSFRSWWVWLRAGWRFSSAYAIEAILGATVGYLTIIVISVFASPSDVAAMRAVISVFGLTSLVINFMRSTVLRELSRSGLNKQKVSKIELVLSLFTLLVVGLTLLVLWLMPEDVGMAVLGDTWLLVLPLLIPGAINRAAASVSAIPTVLLRSVGVAWEATKVRSVIVLASVGLAPVGAYYGGAAGALFAESITYGALALFLTLLLHRRVRRLPKPHGERRMAQQQGGQSR